MLVNWFRTASLFFLTSKLLFAADDNNHAEHSIRLIMSKGRTTEIVLEARQAPLAQVLDEIAKKTGVPVHYSVLPAGLVTATCVGSTVRKVVECLLGPNVDIAFRYSQLSPARDSPDIPEEVWLLGTNIGISQTAVGACSALVMGETLSHVDETAIGQADSGHSEQDKTDDLLAMARSKDSKQREDAISRLAIEGRTNDINVRNTLKESLSDTDASVRAQAVFALAHREGEGAAAELRQAMQDSDDSVRLMAVDSALAVNDIGLLNQALNDSDETIRALAALKLDELAMANNSER